MIEAAMSCDYGHCRLLVFYRCVSLQTGKQYESYAENNEQSV